MPNINIDSSTSSSWSSINSHLSQQTENTSNWSELISNSEFPLKSPEASKHRQKVTSPTKRDASPRASKKIQKESFFPKSTNTHSGLVYSKRSVSHEGLLEKHVLPEQHVASRPTQISRTEQKSDQRQRFDLVSSENLSSLLHGIEDKGKISSKSEAKQTLYAFTVSPPSPNKNASSYANISLSEMDYPASNPQQRSNEPNNTELTSNHSYDRLSSVISCSLLQYNTQDISEPLSQPSFRKDDMVARWLKKGVLGGSQSTKPLKTIVETPKPESVSDQQSYNSAQGLGKSRKSSDYIRPAIKRDQQQIPRDISAIPNYLQNSNKLDKVSPISANSKNSSPLIKYTPKGKLDSKYSEKREHTPNYTQYEDTSDKRTNNWPSLVSLEDIQDTNDSKATLKLPNSIASTDGVASLFLESAEWMSADISFNNMWKKTLNPEFTASGSTEPPLAEYNEYETMTFNQLL